MVGVQFSKFLSTVGGDIAQLCLLMTLYGMRKSANLAAYLFSSGALSKGSLQP